MISGHQVAGESHYSGFVWFLSALYPVSGVSHTKMGDFLIAAFILIYP